MRFESLEPRLLLSADLSYSAMGSADLTLRAGNVEGVERLELIQSNTGDVLASEALANIDGSSGFGARIDANGFDVKLTIDATAESADVIGGIVFEGGAGNSTLEGGDLANVWTLAGSGEGSVGSVTFSGVEKLVGGSASDSLAGPLAETVWKLSGEGSGEVVGVLFEGFENLLSAADNEETICPAGRQG